MMNDVYKACIKLCAEVWTDLVKSLSCAACILEFDKLKLGKTFHFNMHSLGWLKSDEYNENETKKIDFLWIY